MRTKAAKRRRHLRRAANARRVHLRTLVKNNPPAYRAMLRGFDALWLAIGERAAEILWWDPYRPLARTGDARDAGVVGSE